MQKLQSLIVDSKSPSIAKLFSRFILRKVDAILGRKESHAFYLLLLVSAKIGFSQFNTGNGYTCQAFFRPTLMAAVKCRAKKLLVVFEHQISHTD